MQEFYEDDDNLGVGAKIIFIGIVMFLMVFLIYRDIVGAVKNTIDKARTLRYNKGNKKKKEVHL